MKVTFEVTYTESKTFEVELPKEYEEYLLYEDGENKPPTFFEVDALANDNKFYEFSTFIEEESKKHFGKRCDCITEFDDNWNMYF